MSKLWAARDSDHRVEVLQISLQHSARVFTGKWDYEGDCEFWYYAETEAEAKEALMERLTAKIEKYRTVIEGLKPC
jgi:hypothetical protein